MMFILLASTFAALSSVCQASSPVGGQAKTHRDLSYNLIAGYEPGTVVTDHNSLDLDQAKIEELLSFERFDDAWNVYSLGGNSKTVATLGLLTPLQEALNEGESVVGISFDDDEVRGTTYSSYEIGQSLIQVQYTKSSEQKVGLDCKVGGLPVPTLDGCFIEEGQIIVQGKTLNYTYDAQEQNENERTIMKFSIEARSKMYDCSPGGCPYVDYSVFYDYYGAFQYAHQWVKGAYEGRETSFTNGNSDFSKYGDLGRVEAFQKGTAYLSVFMYVIREMEDAIDDCIAGCTIENCNADQVQAWDEAVAFYTGSLEGQYGTTNGGVMLYALAEKRCQNFATCGADSNSVDTKSYVNREVLKNFRLGKQLLNAGKCEDVRPVKQRIVDLMKVPLIQGTLRYAYANELKGLFYDKGKAEGATFAAAILPYVHNCSSSDAATIYENMKYDDQSSIPNFSQVKKAFENTYKCLGVTCKDVGGIWDPANGDYYQDTAPCGGVSSKSRANKRGRDTDRSSRDANTGLVVGLVIGGLVLVALIVLASNFVGPKPAQPVTHMEKPAEIA